jgi:putative FmdB family regulatory protein
MSGARGYTRYAMPIYEYRCTKGHNFDAIQRMSDDSLTKCEVCGAPVQRVLHAPAVHFKGSGFYNTDYGTKKRSREKESHEKSKAKDTSSTSDSSSSTSGSGDTKPASSDSGSSGSDSGKKKKPEPAKASSSSSS